MSDLEKIRNWLKGYPGTLPVKDLKVDYFSSNPGDGSIDPSGLIEVSRTTDIMGNTTVENQLNFALYFTLLKSPGDDQGATDNADLLLDLQKWIQEQSLRGMIKQLSQKYRTHRKILLLLSDSIIQKNRSNKTGGIFCGRCLLSGTVL